MRSHCSQVVVENFFEPCVLFLLSKDESYGYELIRKLNENCRCQVNPGNLYRNLRRLTKKRYIIKKTVKSAIGPKKFIYGITDTGRSLLAQWIAALEKQNQAISALIKNYKNYVES